MVPSVRLQAFACRRHYSFCRGQDFRPRRRRTQESLTLTLPCLESQRLHGSAECPRRLTRVSPPFGPATYLGQIYL